MRCLEKIVLIAFIMLLGWWSEAATLTIREPSVSLEFQDTPSFRFTNEVNLEKGFSKWLVLEMSYTAVEKKESKDKSEWSESLVTEFEILLPSTYRGREVYALLSGRATYLAVPMDGKIHKFQGYVPPQVLRRYLRSGIKLKKNAFVNMDARVSIFSVDRRLLGRYYFIKKGGSEATSAARFARAKDTVAGGVIYIKDMIFARNNTPWQYVNFSTQDLIKPEDNRSNY